MGPIISIVNSNLFSIKNKTAIIYQYTHNGRRTMKSLLPKYNFKYSPYKIFFLIAATLAVLYGYFHLYANNTTVNKNESVRKQDTQKEAPIFSLSEQVWKGRWNQLAGNIKEKWAKLTDDDLLEIEGNQQKLNGIIQKRYGLEEEEAKRQVHDFYNHAAKKLKLDKKDVNMFLTVNKNIWKGHWHTIKGKLKERWSKLTDNELLELEGNQEKLQGILQKQYGIDQERCKRDIDDFYDDLGRSINPQDLDRRQE